MVAGSSSTTQEIRLKKFQPGTMQTNRICVMIGKKGTGKSTLVEDIMWFQQHIPVGAIMSATEEANEAYSKMAPPLFIYKDFDADALQRLINRQKKMKSMFKQNGDKLPFDHRAFLLIDDCMYDKKNFRSPLIRELFMNGRHWDLFVLITIQYLMDITPEVRTNTDYVFALKEGIRKNREKMWKEFFGVFPSFAMFDELFLEVTQDFRCLVLDTTRPSNKIEDMVFWYKAKKRPEFRLGSDWYWDYSAKHVVANGVDKKEREQLDNMRQKVVRVVYEEAQPKQDPPPPTSRDRDRERPRQRDTSPPAQRRFPPERPQQDPSQRNRQQPPPVQRRASPPSTSAYVQRQHQQEPIVEASLVQNVPQSKVQRAAFSAPQNRRLDGFVW